MSCWQSSALRNLVLVDMLMVDGFVVPSVVLGKVQGLSDLVQNPVTEVVLGIGSVHRWECRQVVQEVQGFRA